MPSHVPKSEHHISLWRHFAALGVRANGAQNRNGTGLPRVGPVFSLLSLSEVSLVRHTKATIARTCVCTRMNVPLSFLTVAFCASAGTVHPLIPLIRRGNRREVVPSSLLPRPLVSIPTLSACPPTVPMIEVWLRWPSAATLDSWRKIAIALIDPSERRTDGASL
jgi:hypothetical protein